MFNADPKVHSHRNEVGLEEVGVRYGEYIRQLDLGKSQTPNRPPYALKVLFQRRIHFQIFP